MERIEKSQDGTIKINFKGYSAVIIPTKENKSCVCVSCQIGCPVGCIFCLNGNNKFERDLSSCEILEQVEESKKIIGGNPTSVVFMGSGEPSLNLKEVLDSAEGIHLKYKIPYRRITISTIGLDNLHLLSQMKFNLAISLHSAFDKKRKEISPATCSVERIVENAKEYTSLHRKNYIMIEYTMIKDFNDSGEDLKKLLSFNRPKRTNFKDPERNLQSLVCR